MPRTVVVLSAMKPGESVPTSWRPSVNQSAIA